MNTITRSLAVLAVLAASAAAAPSALDLPSLGNVGWDGADPASFAPVPPKPVTVLSRKYKSKKEAHYDMKAHVTKLSLSGCKVLSYRVFKRGAYYYYRITYIPPAM